jgi:hypothetical protein
MESTALLLKHRRNHKRPANALFDLTEYGKNEIGSATIHYYQLKHSLLRLKKPLTLSDARKIIEGFAARFSARATKGKAGFSAPHFSLVTNRQISPELRPGDLETNERLACCFALGR